MQEQIIQVCFFAAILQGLYLSGLYLFSKRKSVSNRMLAFFLLSLLLEAINSFFPIDYIGGYCIGEFFGLPESKLFLPILFLHYVLLKLSRVKNYKLVLTAGYTLAFLVVGITLANLALFLVSGCALRHYLGWNMFKTLFLSQQVLAFFFALPVAFICLREVNRHRRVVQTYYSEIGLLQVQWLRQFIYLLFPVIGLWGLELLNIAFGWQDRSLSTFVVINWTILVGIIYFISYKAFNEGSSFDQQLAIDDLDDPSGEEGSQVDRAFMDRLDALILEKQLYKKQDFNLYELAKVTGESSRKISASIKLFHSTNFSDWVNRFRVEHAISMLKEESNYTIEGVGFESGFKSRSTMYLAFKKITGKSPGHYKR